MKRKVMIHIMRNVFKYCVDGNLQAMLDEYVHILGEKDEETSEING